MLPAIHARRPRQTHRAGRLSEEHASADVTRADGGRNGESNGRTTQSSNRDRHSARAEALNARLLSERKYNRHQISPVEWRRGEFRACLQSTGSLLATTSQPRSWICYFQAV